MIEEDAVSQGLVKIQPGEIGGLKNCKSDRSASRLRTPHQHRGSRAVAPHGGEIVQDAVQILVPQRLSQE